MPPITVYEAGGLYFVNDGHHRVALAVLGPGGALTVTEAQPGTRFMLMAGKPYGEAPIYNGPYVD